MPDPNTDLKSLAALLRRRIEIIADHPWRDRDPEAHLEALKEVSLDLAAQHKSLAGKIDARLNHYLTQCSYEKALAHIEEAQG